MTSVFEELDTNVLDEDFIKLFKSLIYAQSVVASARVNIRHNIVTPPLWIQSAYSVLLPIVSLCGHFYMSYSYTQYEPNICTVITSSIQASAEIAICIVIMIANNFANRNANIKLYLTLQKIDRKLKVIGKERHNRKIYTFVILGTTFIILNHVVMLTSWFNFMKSVLPAVAVPILLAVNSVENFEALSFIAVLLILNDRVRYIKKSIDFSSKVKWQEMDFDTQLYQRMWQAFRDIVDAIQLTEKLYRIFVLLIVNHLFIYHVMAAAKVIMVPENNKFKWINLIEKPDFMSIKCIARICIISFLVNYLEVNVSQTKESCIQALEKITDESSRCYIKNIIRIISTRFTPMTVYGMFPMNSIAVQLLSLTMNYIIVFLQFSLDPS